RPTSIHAFPAAVSRSISGPTGSHVSKGSPPYVQQLCLTVDRQHSRVRRHKDAVPLIKQDLPTVKGENATAVDTQQHSERHLIGAVTHLLAALRVHQHPVNLKVFAPGQ